MLLASESAKNRDCNFLLDRNSLASEFVIRYSQAMFILIKSLKLVPFLTKLISNEFHFSYILIKNMRNSFFRNALSLAMIQALHKQLREAESSDKARVIIVAAEGPAFSSGHDLKELVRVVRFI